MTDKDYCQLLDTHFVKFINNHCKEMFHPFYWMIASFNGIIQAHLHGWAHCLMVWPWRLLDLLRPGILDCLKLCQLAAKNNWQKITNLNSAITIQNTLSTRSMLNLTPWIHCQLSRRQPSSSWSSHCSNTFFSKRLCKLQLKEFT